MRWTLHRGPAYDKAAAWVDCVSSTHEARLCVWDSGEAELDVVTWATESVDSVHYDLSTLDDLDACLEGLTRRMTGQPPRQQPAQR